MTSQAQRAPNRGKRKWQRCRNGDEIWNRSYCGEAHAGDAQEMPRFLQGEIQLPWWKIQLPTNESEKASRRAEEVLEISSRQ
jgi:hypothetical protein